MMEQDRWVNRPWVNDILGERFQGGKFLGEQTAIRPCLTTPSISYQQ